MDGLDKFIKDLDKAIVAIPKKTKIYKKKLFSLILYEIGQRTAYDTGVTRSLIQKIITELGSSSLAKSLSKEKYEYWKTLEKRLEDSSDYFLRQNDNGDIEIVIEDFGFAQQQGGKVSKIHPRNDVLIIPRHVDFVIDGVNLAQFYDIEKSLDSYIDSIVKIIERG